MQVRKSENFVGCGWGLFNVGYNGWVEIGRRCIESGCYLGVQRKIVVDFKVDYFVLLGIEGEFEGG